MKGAKVGKVKGSAAASMKKMNALSAPAPKKLTFKKVK